MQDHDATCFSSVRISAQTGIMTNESLRTDPSPNAPKCTKMHHSIPAHTRQVGQLKRLIANAIDGIQLSIAPNSSGVFSTLSSIY